MRRLTLISLLLLSSAAPAQNAQLESMQFLLTGDRAIMYASSRGELGFTLPQPGAISVQEVHSKIGKVSAPGVPTVVLAPDDPETFVVPRSAIDNDGEIEIYYLADGKAAKGSVAKEYVPGPHQHGAKSVFSWLLARSGIHGYSDARRYSVAYVWENGIRVVYLTPGDLAKLGSGNAFSSVRKQIEFDVTPFGWIDGVAVALVVFGLIGFRRHATSS